MEQCITCRHWSRWKQDPDYGACICLGLLKIGSLKGITPAKPHTEMTQFDLCFNTGKNFGCIHHEPRK